MVLLYNRDLSVPQIAAIHECGEDVVRTWLHRLGWRWAHPRLAPAHKQDPEAESRLAALAEASREAALGYTHLLKLPRSYLVLPQLGYCWRTLLLNPVGSGWPLWYDSHVTSAMLKPPEGEPRCRSSQKGSVPCPK